MIMINNIYCVYVSSKKICLNCSNKLLLFYNLSLTVFCFFIDFFINSLYYIKYFFYFFSFINILFLNILTFSILKKNNKQLLFLLYHLININGCMLIKFVQWIFKNIKLLDESEKNNKIINLFSNFY